MIPGRTTPAVTPHDGSKPTSCTSASDTPAATSPVARSLEPGGGAPSLSGACFFGAGGVILIG